MQPVGPGLPADGIQPGSPMESAIARMADVLPVPDPSRRGIKRNLGVDELKSPVRPVGYITPTRQYREVSSGHLVRMEEAA